MLSGAVRSKCCYLFKNVLCALTHFLWVTTFLYFAAFYIFQDNFVKFHKEFLTCVPIVYWVRFFVPIFSDRQENIFSRCRSPPSDFDFTSYQLKNRNWRTP